MLRYSIWWRKAFHKFNASLMVRSHDFFRENDIKLIRNSFIPNEKPTIYSATHNFYGDIHCVLSTIGESAFLLYGGAERSAIIDRFGLWLIGSVIVDKACKKSRRKSLEKIIKILDKGGNILIFPEGLFNSSPNSLVKKMHWGLLEAATQTGANIVPVAVDKVGKECRITIGEVFNYSQYPTKHEQLVALRDEMVTLTWELIEMNPDINRDDISINYWINRINDNYEIAQESAEYDEGSEFKPKDEISLGEVLADLYGIEYKSMAVDYEQYRRIERLIENWTKPIKFRG